MTEESRWISVRVWQRYGIDSINEKREEEPRMRVATRCLEILFKTTVEETSNTDHNSKIIISAGKENRGMGRHTAEATSAEIYAEITTMTTVVVPTSPEIVAEMDTTIDTIGCIQMTTEIALIKGIETVAITTTDPEKKVDMKATRMNLAEVYVDGVHRLPAIDGITVTVETIGLRAQEVPATIQGTTEGVAIIIVEAEAGAEAATGKRRNTRNTKRSGIVEMTAENANTRNVARKEGRTAKKEDGAIVEMTTVQQAQGRSSFRISL